MKINEVIYVGAFVHAAIKKSCNHLIGVDPGKVGGYFPHHLNILGGDPPPVMES